MFRRKKTHPAPGETPIEPESIFGPDLAATLTGLLGAEGTARLTQDFSEDVIQRWIRKDADDVLTEQERARIFEGFKTSGRYKVAELGSLYILGDAEKIAARVADAHVATMGLPSDLAAPLARRAVEIIKQLLPADALAIVEELDAVEPVPTPPPDPAETPGEDTSTAASPGPGIEDIIANAPIASWSVEDEVVKNRNAIKATWDVDCEVVELTDQQVEALEQRQPRDTDSHTISDPYLIDLSSNSIFVHPHGAWNDWGYTFFLYRGSLSYVNVDPTVSLSESLYGRDDELSHMAKIMIVFARHLHPKHDRYLVRLEGNLRQLP